MKPKGGCLRGGLWWWSRVAPRWPSGQKPQKWRNIFSPLRSGFERFFAISARLPGGQAGFGRAASAASAGSGWRPSISAVAVAAMRSRQASSWSQRSGIAPRP